MHGLDITIKCLGDFVLLVTFASRSWVVVEGAESGGEVGPSSAVDEVTSKVTKSLGVVGPGN